MFWHGRRIGSPSRAHGFRPPRRGFGFGLPQVMTGDSWMSEVGRGLLAGSSTHWAATFYFVSQVLPPSSFLMSCAVVVRRAAILTIARPRRIDHANVPTARRLPPPPGGGAAPRTRRAQSRSAVTDRSASTPSPTFHPSCLAQYLVTALVLVNVMIAVLLDKVRL